MWTSVSQANNFARGHYTIGKEIVDLVLDRTSASPSMSCLLPWCCSFRYTGRYTQSASINRCFFVWASCCLPGTSCQSLNLHSCVYHRASESGSASWPTTAAGQKILSAFGITCNLTLQMCLWNFPASNTVVAYIQAPGCRASASTMSFGQTHWMLLSTSDEPLSSMGGL